MLKSSNLPFHAAVWETAKSCSHVSALGKRFRSEPLGSGPPAGGRAAAGSNRQAPSRDSAPVDIVAANGEEWIKVSTITERRLLFEIAETGWEEGSQPSETMDEQTDDYNSDSRPRASGASLFAESDDPDGALCDEIGLVKVARELVVIASANRVRRKAPQVRIVLTRIQEGVSSNIDLVLARMRSAGAVVQCGGGQPPSATLETFRKMLPSSDAGISSSLNLDCTILLALISDISHCRLEPHSSHHSSVRQQILSEPADGLLPSHLYPILRGRLLFTATQAARRMREIVNTLGTPSEKARAGILLGERAFAGSAAPELRPELVERSVHPVPFDLQLPVSVVPENIPFDLSSLPPVALELARTMSSINKSVFLLGWKEGWTTVTSNRGAVRSIETALARQSMEDQVSPSLWLCKTARSLLGKEKPKLA